MRLALLRNIGAGAEAAPAPVARDGLRVQATGAANGKPMRLVLIHAVATAHVLTAAQSLFIDHTTATH